MPKPTRVLIDNINFYSVPFYYDSENRIVDNVKERLKPFLLHENFDKKLISFEQTNNLINLVFNISFKDKYKDLKSVNYISFESDIYPEFNLIYGFLEMNSVNSFDSYSFNFTLDIFATAGKKILNSLVDKQLKVVRKHVDRFIWDDNQEKLKINVENPVLWNGEFNTLNTIGQTWLYQTSFCEKISDESYTYGVNYKYDNNNDVKIRNFNFCENIEPEYGPSKRNLFFYYGIMSRLGDYGKTKITYSQLLTNYPADFVIVPLHNGDDNSINIKGKLFNGCNNIECFEIIQKGKLWNIIVSPFRIVRKDGWDPQHAEATIIDNNYLLFYEDFNSIQMDANVKKLNLGTFIHQKTSIVNCEYLFNLIPYSFTTDANDNFFEDQLEVGRLNPHIFDYSFYFNQHIETKYPLDIVNLLKSDFKGEDTYVVNANGIDCVLNFGNYQTYNLMISQTLGFQTNMGADYVTKHASTISNQYAKANLGLVKSVVSGAGSILSNPADLLNIFHLLKKVYHAGTSIAGSVLAKEAITAAITDSFRLAPAHNFGSNDANNSLVAQNVFKYGPFVVTAKLPNIFFWRQIYNFWKKFGYDFNNYIIPKKKNWWKTRTTFDYLEITNINDVLSPLDLKNKSLLNTMYIQEIDKIFKNGIRIWHDTKIEIGDYSALNVEFIFAEKTKIKIKKGFINVPPNPDL